MDDIRIDEAVERSPEEVLSERERALAEREMRIEAGRALRERALPEELIGAVNCQSAEALEKSVDAAERAFRSAVERAVAERMRGEPPARAVAPRDAGDMSDEDYYNTFYRKSGG
jgi:hypothetical protein